MVSPFPWSSTNRFEMPLNGLTFPLYTLLLLASSVWSKPLSSKTRTHKEPPTVTLSSNNKSNPATVFVGRALPEFNQDLFLGIKYADKPVRFTPSELRTTYVSNDIKSGPVLYNATEYGYDCPGYGSDTTKLVNMGLIHLNEDCLNLNILRPQTEERTGALLPVMIWIFGGGWQQGATADPRYVAQ